MKSDDSVENANSNQELVGSSKKKKQVLVLFGLLLVAILAIGAIVGIIVLIYDNKNSGGSTTKPPLQLEELLKGQYQPKRFNGTWISDTHFHYFDADGNFIIYDVIARKGSQLIANNVEQFTEAFQYDFSFDQKYILLATEHRKIFRHSFYALYSVLDVETKIFTNLTIAGQYQPLKLVKWSPVDNSMIIVSHDNNIYYKKSLTQPEIKITLDGDQFIFNGVPDWVNEEEVFSSNSATWFSPDGKKIAFVKFDDKNVPVMQLPIYGPPGSIDFQYPKNLHVHYPKVGTHNPIVKLMHVDLSVISDDGQGIDIKEIVTPQPLKTDKEDHLITSVSWANNVDLITVWMNRVQNQGLIEKCTMNATPDGHSCVQVKSLNSEGGWVEFFTAPFFSADGLTMAYLGPHNGVTAGETFRHLITVNLGTFVESHPTSGNFVVLEILMWHKTQNLIFFMANTPEDSKVQHLYTVKPDGSSQKMCLTCDLEEKQKYFSVEFSKDGNQLSLVSLGPDIPKSFLYSWEINGNNVTLKRVMDWETNEDLHKALENRNTPKIIYDDIVLDNGSTSKVLMVVPPNLDESKKHPMLIEVYGGPDSSNVNSRWSMDWGSYLVSNKSYIYVKIDGRGSGLRGDKVLHEIYRKLGTVEIEDQIETAQKLQAKYPYIDADNSAIWGWSYGGYASGMALAKDTNKVFDCAISVAPVTDWVLYDSIYTERYMGLPDVSDNLEGYENARLTKLADKLRNKKYMLVHGTLDDNVHYQQGMLLARTLERQDILFKQISYPDEDHSLAGVRPHLYHSLEKFLDECFTN